MTIPEDVADTLRDVLQSYLAAEGDPLDDVRCPKLRAAWKALGASSDENDKNAVKAWLVGNCRWA